VDLTDRRCGEAFASENCGQVRRRERLVSEAFGESIIDSEGVWQLTFL
jgi:hypothetical protein